MIKFSYQKNMNLKSTFLSFLLSLLLLNVYSQEKVLVLTDRYSKGEKVITGGKRLKVVSTKDEIYQGKLAFVDRPDDSVYTKIIVGTDTLDLDKIKVIKRKSPLALTIPGYLLTTGGGGGTIFGIYVLATASSAGEWSDLVSIIGGSITAGGILVTAVGILLVSGKKFEVTSWRYSIKRK